ncbi:MAG: DUF2845 domain-containing protein [Desulfosudis oleivorans]|nr:DUF2845 domain-containing protein [Desulfosudis oleivorans]
MKITSSIHKIIIPGIIILLPVYSLASGFFCGTQNYNYNDSSYSIRLKCGEPTSKKNVGHIIDEDKKGELVIEEWLYDKGDYRLIITMTGNKVTKVVVVEGKK